MHTDNRNMAVDINSRMTLFAAFYMGVVGPRGIHYPARRCPGLCRIPEVYRTAGRLYRLGGDVGHCADDYRNDVPVQPLQLASRVFRLSYPGWAQRRRKRATSGKRLNAVPVHGYCRRPHGGAGGRAFRPCKTADTGDHRRYYPAGLFIRASGYPAF